MKVTVTNRTTAKLTVLGRVLGPQKSAVFPFSYNQYQEVNDELSSYGSQITFSVSEDSSVDDRFEPATRSSIGQGGAEVVQLEVVRGAGGVISRSVVCKGLAEKNLILPAEGVRFTVLRALGSGAVTVSSNAGTIDSEAEISLGDGESRTFWLDSDGEYHTT